MTIPGRGWSVEFTNTLLNAAPVAQPDAYSLIGGAPLTVPAASGVLANDADADGDTLTAQLVDTTTRGTLVLNDDGSFTYTPGEDTVGTDSFTNPAFDGRRHRAP